MNDHKPMRPRPVCESKSEMTEIVLPNDANPLNALLGGRLMHWIDMAAAMGPPSIISTFSCRFVWATS